MSTFKKLFATIASAMVIVSTLPAAVLGQASYGAELEGAYAYSYSMGVTTMPTIDAARMYDGLTRAELAKMMSEWAMEVKGLETDESMDCSFTDLAPIAGSDLEAYAVVACQLGLMGVGTNGLFNPTGVVDRATFGTVLSRVIRGDTYNNAGGTWYSAHLSALKAVGVMNNIDNPMMPELR